MPRLRQDPLRGAPPIEDARQLRKVRAGPRSLSGVVAEIHHNVHALQQVLVAASEDFAGHYEAKKRWELEIRRRIAEARARVLQQVDRCFDEAEAQLVRSITAYNERTAEEFARVDDSILELQEKLEAAAANLSSEKTLRTVITYYANDSLALWKQSVAAIEASIADLEARAVNVEVDAQAVQDIVDRVARVMKVVYEGVEPGSVPDFIKKSVANSSGASHRHS